MIRRDHLFLFGLYASIFFVGMVIAVLAKQFYNPDPKVFRGKTMGTTYTVKIADGFFQSEKALAESIDAVLDKIDQQMSTYRPDSDLSKFNRQQSDQWQEVPSDFAFVVSEAQQISKLTDGAFDVTVGPLVNLWGFGLQKDLPIPNQRQIDDTRRKTGYENIEVDLARNALRKKIAGLYVDLSAIAKGYAVDAVAQHIERGGIENYLVEIGGEIRTRGKKYGKKWRVAIEVPDIDKRAIDRIIDIDDTAMATSGDYRNFRYREDGSRFSHTIDPRTGKPIDHNLASVTVFNNSCARADAWATALMVLGEKDGFALAQKLGLACHFIIRSGDGFYHKATIQFQAMTLLDNEEDSP